MPGPPKLRYGIDSGTVRGAPIPGTGRAAATAPTSADLGRARKRGVRFAPDSLLEETGFEPSVPRKAPAVAVVSLLVRADFSVGGNQAEVT
jgi:hypothetical protein